MILFIDNYDSFVYNLVRYTEELNQQTIVARNDKISINEIENLNPSHIIISPGPCAPDQAGVSLEIIKYFGPKIPILGICLGHQAIGQVFGGKVIRAPKPIHGKSSMIKHDGKNIFDGLPNPFTAGRYHSLTVSQENFPSELHICAHSDDNEIMAIQHRTYPIYGLQFHPESVLTEQGHQLLQNFLKI